MVDSSCSCSGTIMTCSKLSVPTPHHPVCKGIIPKNRAKHQHNKEHPLHYCSYRTFLSNSYASFLTQGHSHDTLSCFIKGWLVPFHYDCPYPKTKLMAGGAWGGRISLVKMLTIFHTINLFAHGRINETKFSTIVKATRASPRTLRCSHSQAIPRSQILQGGYTFSDHCLWDIYRLCQDYKKIVKWISNFRS